MPSSKFLGLVVAQLLLPIAGDDNTVCTERTVSHFCCHQTVGDNINFTN